MKIKSEIRYFGKLQQELIIKVDTRFQVSHSKFVNLLDDDLVEIY